MSKYAVSLQVNEAFKYQATIQHIVDAKDHFVEVAAKHGASKATVAQIRFGLNNIWDGHRSYVSKLPGGITLRLAVQDF